MRSTRNDTVALEMEPSRWAEGGHHELCGWERDCGRGGVRKAWGWLGRCTGALAETEKTGEWLPRPLGE